MLDNNTVNRIIKQLTVRPLEWRIVFLQSVKTMLKNDRAAYKMFGCYWWAVKKAMQSQFLRDDAWWNGVYFDQRMYEIAQHKDEFTTLVAAAYYLNLQDEVLDQHQYEIDGVIRSYSLFDENAEC